MRRILGIAWALAILGAAGCAEKWQAATYPASGRLAINGQPAAGALVQLVARGPAPDERNSHPWGKVRDDGSFELTTYDGRPGAPPGEYGVGITWPFDSSVMGSPDRLGGKLADASASALTVTLRAEPNQIPPIKLDKVRVDGKPRPGASGPPIPR